MKYLYLPAFISGLILVGCTEDPVRTNDNGDWKSYQEKVAEYKKTAVSAEDLENRLTELRSEFNIKLDPIALSKDFGSENPRLYLKDKPGTGTQIPAGTFLGKTSATSGLLLPFAVKQKTCDIKTPYQSVAVVWPGKTLTVTSTLPSGSSADPFLVLYEITNGNYNDYNKILDLNVLAYNDDYTGLAPSVTWTNNTGVPKDVSILMFAYSQSSWGVSNLSVVLNNVTTNLTNLAVTSVALFNDMSGYITVDGNAISSAPSGWHPYAVGNSAFTTVSGDWVGGGWGQYAPSSTGDSKIWAFNFTAMKGRMNDDYLGTGSGLFMGPDLASMPTGYHYPSVVLLGGYSNGGTMNFIQFVGFEQN